eukprot:9487146-Pyramimonas_sp.AAC.1
MPTGAPSHQLRHLQVRAEHLGLVSCDGQLEGQQDRSQALEQCHGRVDDRADVLRNLDCDIVRVHIYGPGYVRRRGYKNVEGCDHHKLEK